MPPTRLPAVDAYIAQAKPFAQPILIHLRDTLHRAVPDLTEAIKWSRPFFLHRDIILGNIAAFNQHCSLSLWGAEMASILRADGIETSEGMGTFGRIASLTDLPPSPVLESYIRRAATLIAEGTRSKSIQRVVKPTPRPEVDLPPSLVAALQRDSVAAGNFAKLSPSCRREYADWIADAKREETRAKRVLTTLEWITEGKPRNWKHQRPT